MDTVEIDPTFEPQQRARSNTWPLPRPDTFVDKDESDQGGTLLPDGSVKPPDASHLPKKNSARRNAWGNMSYADLITQAIQSCPDKRLTLSQIYDWMVQNVPYFKDKGDSNSSAGWKNSIRHNLSLHNRFMRVQNEGTGKSSWWMINPDAKPGKAARRRATSMETQKYEKKRGRIKKKVEALRNGMDTTPSPSSSISESLDMFPDSPLHPAFQLSPDFRPRASSNASSCGRLSPIPAIESDMHDSEVPPMSPIPWGSELGYGNGGAAAPSLERYGADQLVDTLAETMKLGGGDGGAYLTDLKSSPSGQLSPTAGGGGGGGPHLHNLSPVAGPPQANGYGPSLYGAGAASNARFDFLPAAPPSAPFRSDAKLSPQRILADMSATTSYNLTSLQALSPARSVHSVSPPRSDALAHHHPHHHHHQSASPHSSSSAYHNNSARTSPSGFLSPGQPTPQESVMLRAALSTHKEASDVVPPPLLTNGGLRGGPASSSISHMMGQLVAINNGIPNDLDFSLDALQGGLECDVDQVIRHELSVDGNLDFNFAEPAAAAAAAAAAAGGQGRATAGHQWVR